MNIKMATNAQLSTTESKKQTKQTSRTNRIIEMEVIWTLPVWERNRENEGKGVEIKKYILVDTDRRGMLRRV